LFRSWGSGGGGGGGGGGCCCCGGCTRGAKAEAEAGVRARLTCRIRAARLHRLLRLPERLGWSVHGLGEDAAFPVAAEAAGA